MTRALKLTPPRPRLLEKDLQAQVVAVLSQLGYVVLSTGLYRPSAVCPCCGKRFTAHTANGSSAGVPDLLITSAAWTSGVNPSPLWCGIEMKGEKTPVTPLQQKLADDGHTIICRSIAEVIDAVAGVEAALGQDGQRIARFWAVNPRRAFE